MADNRKEEEAKTSQAAPVEQDALFRLQMAVSDFVLGNAKYAGYLVGIVLLGALIYGVTTSYLHSRAEGEFEAIAAVEHRMPKQSRAAMFGIEKETDDPAKVADLQEGARRFEAAAKDAHGSASVYAWLQAADAWERSGNAEARMAAIEAATKVGDKDLPGFSADSAWAGALIDAGRTEEGLGVYRTMAGKYQGFYAERSLLMLAEAQLAAGKAAEARLTVDELKSRFPSSPRAASIAALEAKVAAGG